MSKKTREGKAIEPEDLPGGESAGGDSSKFKGGGDSISGTIGSNAQGVVVGKNIFQSIIVVGTVKIPVLPVLVLIGIVAAAVIFFGLRLLGPEKMTGSFNLAVAEFGQEQGDGRIVSAENGQLISRRLFEGLQIEFDNLPSAERANFHPQVWQDSLDITQKRVKIGIIPGDTAQARWTAACLLAAKINASVIIYGNLPSKASGDEFVPEYAICNNDGLRVDADEIVGVHQVVEGLPAELASQIGRPDIDLAANMRINQWGRALTFFSLGIMYDLQGRADLALPVFQQASNQLDAGAGPVGAVLWFFVGREELILSAVSGSSTAGSSERETHLVKAQSAFETALNRNPAYARARIGLGGVFLDRAQNIPPAQRLKTPDLNAAIREYQQAVDDAPGSPGAFVETKARLSLASAWILQGEAYRDLELLPEASDAFNQAIQAAQTALEPLAQAGQLRVLAQAYLTLGEANHEQGHLKLLQGDPSSSRSYFQAAAANYELCIQQKDGAVTDQVLTNQIVAGLCQPNKASVEAALADLGN